jgi:hypothetical protein
LGQFSLTRRAIPQSAGRRWHVRFVSSRLAAACFDGIEALHANVKITVAGAFTASETLDMGIDLGPPVSLTISTGALSILKGTSLKCPWRGRVLNTHVCFWPTRTMSPR